MEYDYEFMWDYEISVHDDLDENMHTSVSYTHLTLPTNREV